MCDKADKARENENNKELIKEGCRKTKRCLKLIRGFDKDLKLDIAAAGTYAQFERNDQPMPSTPNNIKVIIILKRLDLLLSRLPLGFSSKESSIYHVRRLRPEIDFEVCAQNQST